MTSLSAYLEKEAQPREEKKPGFKGLKRVSGGILAGAAGLGAAGAGLGTAVGHARFGAKEYDKLLSHGFGAEEYDKLRRDAKKLYRGFGGDIGLAAGAGLGAAAGLGYHALKKRRERQKEAGMPAWQQAAAGRLSGMLESQAKNMAGLKDVTQNLREAAKARGAAQRATRPAFRKGFAAGALGTGAGVGAVALAHRRKKQQQMAPKMAAKDPEVRSGQYFRAKAHLLRDPEIASHVEQMIDREHAAQGEDIKKSLKRIGAGALGGAVLIGAQGAVSRGVPAIVPSALVGGAAGAGLGGTYDLYRKGLAGEKAEASALRAHGLSVGDRPRKGLGRVFGPVRTTYHMSPETLERFGYKPKKSKTASLSDYSEVFDKVSSGEFGEETQAALAGICQAIDFKVAEATKVAYDGPMGAPAEESDRDARKRRLAELLKRREHSGTATGSASPNPPKG